MRQPKPWYRKFNDTWYVQVADRQIPLAKGREAKDEAFRRYHELMAQQDIAQVDDEARINVASLCEAFLDWSQRHNSPASYLWYRGFLQEFCNQHGTLAVASLKPFHVTRWIDSHEWSPSTRRAAITCLKRALNWAVEQGYLQSHPLRNVKRPASGSRSRLITPDEHQRLLDATDEHFRRFLIALRETGARPGEVCAVTAAHVDLTQRMWILPLHKTGKKTGRPRIILLNDVMTAMTRDLIEKNPAGPLFRNQRGQPWNRNAVRLRMQRLRKQLGLSDDVVAYCYRHTYTTQGLTNGVPIATMAELLGHSDTKMISAHYSHLSQRIDHLRDAAQRATQEGECA